MSLRRRARHRAVQLLYSLEFNPEPLDKTFASYWNSHSVSAEERAFTEMLVSEVRARSADIDRALAKCAVNWDISRMPYVDRSILRLAAFELMFRDDIPAAVSIDEAVRLAREFCADKSGGFVNGVLDAVRAEFGHEAQKR